MKRIIRSLLTVSIGILLTTTVLFAVDTQSEGSSAGDFRKVGAAGSQFLKIGVGARASGMAGAYGSVGNDISSLYWNAAGIADIKDIAGSFSYTSWFAGFSHNFVGGCIPLSDKYRAAFSITSFTSDQIPITTIEKDQGTGAKYSVSDFAIGLSFGGYITDQFSFGTTLKYIQNAFSTVSASGIAFDVGTIYKTGFQGTKIGFSIHNLGGQQNYTGQDLNRTGKLVPEQYASPSDLQLLSSPYNLPLTFRASISTDVMSFINGESITPSDADHKWIACVDFETLSDTPEQFSIGTEYVWKNFIAIRGGYRFGHDTFNVAGGVGLKYISGGFDGQIDYSISPAQNLGLVNRFTLSVRVP
ncbi:MAG: PorV/PorQ family protein [Bacteroidetes bacterium]|nr:PorV/PorQ family protein [Bacteroidota bacterium]